MQSSCVMDNIEVIAAFKKGRIIPLVFSWRGKRYQDFTVIKCWDKYENDRKVLCYHLRLEHARYEICFYTDSLHWTLYKTLSFF